MVTGDTPTERVRIDSNGFVGIGTTSPQRKFVVSDAGNEGFEFYPGSSDTGNTLNHYDRGSSAFIDITTNADQHIFGRADGEKMRIDSSGRLLLGNNSSNALTGGFGNALQVEGTSAGTSSIAIIRKATMQIHHISILASLEGHRLVLTRLLAVEILWRLLILPALMVLVFNSHANIRAHVDGTPGNADSPGRLSFWTTANGSPSPTERMRINNAGYVGIGTSSVDGQLEVRSASALGIISRSTSTQGTDTNKAYRARNNSGTDTFSVSYKGQGYFANKVGIGATSPDGTLHVHTNSAGSVTASTAADDLVVENNGDCGITILTATGNNNSAIFFGTPNDSVGAAIRWNDNANQMMIGPDQSGAQLRFNYGDGAEGMIINSSGNVGINTSSPGEKLDVNGQIRARAHDNSKGAFLNSDGALEVYRSGGDAYIDFKSSTSEDFDVRLQQSDNGFLVRTGGDGATDERLRVDSSGRLLVGTSSGSYGAATAHEFVGSNSDYIFSLTNDTASDSNGHRFSYLAFTGKQSGGEKSMLAAVNGAHDGAQDDTKGMLIFRTNSGSEGGIIPTERMRIDSDGKIFIGSTGDPSTASTDDPKVRLMPGEVSVVNHQSSSLHLNRTGNNGAVAKFFRNGGDLSGKITVTTSSTSYETSSDYRLKENVVELADGITRVKQLAPKRFNFIVDADTTVDGFLAHEAQAVVPEAVSGERDGEEMQGIDQSKLVPLLTAALQEAIAKIETLEQRLTDAGL